MDLSCWPLPDIMAIYAPFRRLSGDDAFQEVSA
jgi:hypothetical protein